MADGMLALTWNNHSSTFLKTLSTVRQKERYTDVTLSCGGKFYQLHKMVLSSCSDYFEKVFEQTPCKHPVIVLRDVSCFEIEALLNYMYLGSVSVAQNDLARLIKVAELFQIKGLAVPDELPKSDSSAQKRNDCRDSKSNMGNQRDTMPENRTRRSISDPQDSPLPKRPRTSDSFMRSEVVERGVSNVVHHNEYSQPNERLGQPVVSDDGGSGRRVSSGSNETPRFDIPIKEEIVHDIIDSDSESHDQGDSFDALKESPPMVGFDPIANESQLEPFIPKPEPEDVPPDEEAHSQPMLESDGYSEPLLALPGPSDAQGWYSEGDSSSGGVGGLTVSGKGVMGDESQDMLPMELSQQQQMMSPVKAPPPHHYQSGDEGPGKAFQSPICPYSTDSKTDFQNHHVVHTGEKPHQCSYCPTSFAKKSTLTRHMQTHTGDRPFKCPLCSYRAARKSSLKSHTFRIHGSLDTM